MLIAAMACLLIAGCQRDPMRGVVVKKNHRPAWTETVFMPSQVGDLTIILPTTIIHPEQWDIVVLPDGTDDRTDAVLVVVTRARWESLEVGGVWERDDTIRQDRQPGRGQ